jgi:hypothetical protein
MTPWAIQMRAKTLAMAQAWYGTRFKTYRLTPMLQVTPTDLPVFGVYYLRERRQWPQPEQSMPKFDEALTLGLSGGFHVETDKQNELSSLELAMSEIDEWLLRDSSFLKPTKGISEMDYTAQFAKVGETTLYEIRVALTVLNDSYHPPKVVDDFKTLHVTTQYPDKAHVDSGTPQIDRVYELDQT